MTELAQLDLNLLVVLHALLVERHVTRAAARIHISQPAASRSLHRLRDMFGDPLLVRSGRSMELTPRAENLLGPLDEVLRNIRGLVAPVEFVPANATGRVRIAAPDVLTYMLLPALMRRLSEQAPGLELQVVQWSHRWREHLASGDVDLTIGEPTGDEPGIYTRALVVNTWASVVRTGHPALQEPWTVQSFAALPHLLVSITGDGEGQVDRALAAHGLRRRVAMRIPYAVLSPLIIADTDLVLTTARWLAEKLAHGSGLCVLDTPVELAPVDLPMVWHERVHRDPRHRWVRQLLVDVASA